MRIADEKIEEVRRSSDIVDVIGSSVPLKKRGKNYIGLCPFHQEKTPSFNVSPDKQMYHCFGCGAGGNVFTFVMERDKVSFVEAVRTLAERAGIALPESAADRAEATEHEGLYAACRTAGMRYYENLAAGADGNIAQAYLQHRGFSDATIRKFGLGYSRNTWDDLATYAAELKLDLAQFEKAGLLMKREDGSSLYDRFRGRVMFPIFSPSGRPIGFGARKLRDDDPLGKYINSPETPIYSKSRTLYGLFQSKESVREKGVAILVEGYADLITVVQAGIENIVATSGTALTEEQIQLIGRYAKSVTLVYDADSAGSKATLRGVDLIIEGGLDVRVATLPEGDDPDSYVRAHGGDAFAKLVEGAVSFLDFKASSFREQGLLATPEGKTEAVRSIVGTISRMKDEIKRNFYIQSIAEKYGIYESVLYREMEKVIGLERKRAQPFPGRQQPPGTPGPGSPRAGSANAPLPAHERDLLKVILEAGPQMAEFVFSHLTRETFQHPMALRAVDAVQHFIDSGRQWDVTSLINELQDADLRAFVSDCVVTKYEISRGWSEVKPGDLWTIAEKCILRAKGLGLRKEIEENFRLLKEAQRRGEDVARFMEENIRLEKARKELESTKLIDDATGG
jgi:DNA primase